MPHEFHVQLVTVFIFAQLASNDKAAPLSLSFPLSNSLGAWSNGRALELRWSKSGIVTVAADGNGKRLGARKAELYFTIPCAAQNQSQAKKAANKLCLNFNGHSRHTSQANYFDGIFYELCDCMTYVCECIWLLVLVASGRLWAIAKDNKVNSKDTQRMRVDTRRVGKCCYANSKSGQNTKICKRNTVIKTYNQL